MSQIDQKLREMGLELPPLQVFPNSNRAAWRLTGNLLFLSGHPPAALPGVKIEGQVDGDLSEEEGYQAARSCAANILSTVRSAIGDLDRVRRVIKLLGFVNTTPGFTRQFAVMDGASDLFLELFGESAVSTRSAIGVTALSRGIPIEIESIFEIDT